MRSWKNRLHASAIHLGFSLIIVSLIAWLVFEFWYPYPYREISGGRELFMLIIVVDVVMGPLITLMVFNQTKTRSELILDLSMVGLLQLAALGYGLWTVFEARPVHLVFEYHRLAVVSAADLEASTLAQAPAALQVSPLTGPTLLSLRPFKSVDEQYQSTMIALNGVPQAAQPALWQPWEAERPALLRESRPVTELKKRFGSQTALIDDAIAATGRSAQDMRYLPLVTRKDAWTVLIDAETTLPVGYLPLDSF